MKKRSTKTPAITAVPGRLWLLVIVGMMGIFMTIRYSIVVFNFVVTQAVRGSISSLLYNPFSFRGGMPPSWLSVSIIDHALTLMWLTGILIWTYLGSKKVLL